MPTRDITNARILVVDDNPTNIELLLALLEDAGYQFLEGLSTPEDIDQKMTSFEPHLILLDYRMPRMNGGDVLTHLHDQYGDDVPPVVMITAQDDKVIRLRSLKLGAIDFLTKPFDYDEVLQRLKNILEAHYLPQERREASLFYQSVANRNSAELEQMALEDALTGLPNRRAVLEEVHTLLQSGNGCSVVFLVIDDLEDIAQFHGYPVAEAFIRYLALFLQRGASGKQLLGSWGQQEYVVVFDAKCDQKLVQLAQTLVDLATGDHHFETLLLTVGARAGISSSLDTHIEPDELIRQAALALPKKGGERVGVFSDELHQMLAERLNLRNDLRQAIESGHLQLYFQPKYGLSDGCVNGAEALRWMTLVPAIHRCRIYRTYQSM